MPIELGRPKYYKYSECIEGQLLVKKGEFMGITEGRYGDQYSFYQHDGVQVILNKAGQLAWRIEQSQIVEGGYYDIYYKGSEKLESGTFAGKEAHSFRVDVYSAKEIEDITGVKAPAKTEDGPKAEQAPTPTAKETEDLDDLE